MSDEQENPIICVPVGFISITTFFINFDGVRSLFISLMNVLQCNVKINLVNDQTFTVAGQCIKPHRYRSID